MDWCIILENASGHRTKRYVGAVGYASCDVGSYVEKKRGFGEFPRRLGELTPSDVEELARRRRRRGQR
jgi:hypothetical protein